MPKQITLQEVFRRSGRTMLRKAMSETPAGLLDEFPRYSIAARHTESEGPGRAEPRSPRPCEIDYSPTTDEMILEGQFVLKSRRSIGRQQ